MKRAFKPFVALTLIFWAAAAAAQDRPRIVAVNHALQSLAERLVGDAAEVVFPVPAGTDPSFWRPSVADISMIQSADLILLNGAGFATWVDRVSLPRARLVNTSASAREQYIVTESITHSHGDGDTHSHEGLASYTWLDPTLAIAQAQALAAGVSRLGLAPPQDVYARLTALTAELEALDAETAEALSSAAGVGLIATHPRYQYFARRYGLSISALEWEAGASPSEDELTTLAAMASAQNARVVIWEAAPPAEALEAVAALGLRNVVFEPMAGATKGDYFEAFRRGVAALTDALALSSN
ncbi:MAG: metal ABC transporter substrate-binding protein [Pseudomonadota bacterium]